MATFLGRNSACGESWAAVLLVATLLGRNSACGESLAAVLLVATFLGRNSDCGEPPGQQFAQLCRIQLSMHFFSFRCTFSAFDARFQLSMLPFSPNSAILLVATLLGRNSACGDLPWS